MDYRTSRLFISDEILDEGCTVPGCNFPHELSKKILRVSGGQIACGLANGPGSEVLVECSLECNPGWKPLDNITSIQCPIMKGQREERRRLTNKAAKESGKHGHLAITSRLFLRSPISHPTTWSARTGLTKAQIMGEFIGTP